MIVGQFKPLSMKPPGEEEKEPEQKQTPEAVRSSSSEEFLKTPEAKEFVNKWTDALKKAKATPTYSERRTVVDLTSTLHRVSNLSDKEVMKLAEGIMMKMCGLDGFSGTLSRMKATTESLIKGLKSVLGG